jgi:hypothetical protein
MNIYMKDNMLSPVTLKCSTEMHCIVLTGEEVNFKVSDLHVIQHLGNSGLSAESALSPRVEQLHGCYLPS